MALQVKVFAAKLEALSLISGTHIVELTPVVSMACPLTSTYIQWHVLAHTRSLYIYTYMNISLYMRTHIYKTKSLKRRGILCPVFLFENIARHMSDIQHIGLNELVLHCYYPLSPEHPMTLCFFPGLGYVISDRPSDILSVALSQNSHTVFLFFCVSPFLNCFISGFMDYLFPSRFQSRIWLSKC